MQNNNLYPKNSWLHGLQRADQTSKTAQIGQLTPILNDSQVGELHGFSHFHSLTTEAHPNLWACFFALTVISFLLNIALIFYIWRQQKNCQILRKEDTKTSHLPPIEFNRLTSLNSEILANEALNNAMETTIHDNVVQGKQEL